MCDTFGPLPRRTTCIERPSTDTLTLLTEEERCLMETVSWALTSLKRVSHNMPDRGNVKSSEVFPENPETWLSAEEDSPWKQQTFYICSTVPFWYYLKNCNHFKTVLLYSRKSYKCHLTCALPEQTAVKSQAVYRDTHRIPAADSWQPKTIFESIFFSRVIHICGFITPSETQSISIVSLNIGLILIHFINAGACVCLNHFIQKVFNFNIIRVDYFVFAIGQDTIMIYLNIV